MDSIKHIPTIKDVAATAGVSTASVSHYINKTRPMSDELGARIGSAIKELGYVPNLLVGGLRKNKTYSVGLIIPCISNETMGGFAESLQKSLQTIGHSLIICNTSYSENQELRAIRTMIMNKVDAVVAIPTSSSPKPYLQMRRFGIPLLFIDRVIDGFSTDVIKLDNYHASIKVVEHLVSLGHRHICYVDRAKAQSHSNEQRQGYLDGLKKYGFDQEYVLSAEGYDYASGQEVGQRIIKTMPEVTAIYAYYDIIACGVMRAIAEAGYQVPEDFSVVGFDAMPFAMSMTPKLTSVCFPVEEIGQKAFQLISNRINNKRTLVEDNFTQMTVIPELVIGETTTYRRQL